MRNPCCELVCQFACWRRVLAQECAAERSQVSRPNQPIEVRVDDLISAMTLGKSLPVVIQARANSRLANHAYTVSESSRVANAGTATDSRTHRTRCNICSPLIHEMPSSSYRSRANITRLYAPADATSWKAPWTLVSRNQHLSRPSLGRAETY